MVKEVNFCILVMILQILLSILTLEVAFLLWNYRLPKKSEYDEFVKAIRAEYEIPVQLVTAMKRMPKDSDPMEVLRTSVSFLGLIDPERNDNSLEANRRIALRLTAKFPTIVAAWDYGNWS